MLAPCRALGSCGAGQSPAPQRSRLAALRWQGNEGSGSVMEALRMITMAFGSIPAQAVAVAAELGIVDHLVGGPRTAAELARATGTHAPSLYRLLRALATLEVLAEDAEGRFSSTPLGDTLRSDAPGSVRGAVIMAGDPTFTRACGDMVHSVRTRAPAFDHVFGAPFFDYPARHSPAGPPSSTRGVGDFSRLESPPP